MNSQRGARRRRLTAMRGIRYPVRLGGCAGWKRLDGIQGLTFSELSICAGVARTARPLGPPPPCRCSSRPKRLRALHQPNGTQAGADAETDCSRLPPPRQICEPLRGLALNQADPQRCSRLRAWTDRARCRSPRLELALRRADRDHACTTSPRRLVGSPVCEALTSMIGCRRAEPESTQQPAYMLHHFCPEKRFCCYLPFVTWWVVRFGGGQGHMIMGGGVVQWL